MRTTKATLRASLCALPLAALAACGSITPPDATPSDAVARKLSERAQ